MHNETNDESLERRKWCHHNAEIAPLWLMCAAKLSMEPSYVNLGNNEMTARWQRVRHNITWGQLDFARSIWKRAENPDFKHNGWTSSSVVMEEWRFNNYIFSRTKRIKYV